MHFLAYADIKYFHLPHISSVHCTGLLDVLVGFSELRVSRYQKENI
jgi:hypothetical protein